MSVLALAGVSVLVVATPGALAQSRTSPRTSPGTSTNATHRAAVRAWLAQHAGSRAPRVPLQVSSPTIRHVSPHELQQYRAMLKSYPNSQLDFRSAMNGLTQVSRSASATAASANTRASIGSAGFATASAVTTNRINIGTASGTSWVNAGPFNLFPAVEQTTSGFEANTTPLTSLIYSPNSAGNLGPLSIGGRVNGVAFSTANRLGSSGLLLAATANGGIWRYNLSNLNAAPVQLSSDAQFPVLRTSVVAVDPVNPSTVYVGTGDYPGTPSTGAARGIGYGIGLMKTVNADAPDPASVKWQNVGNGNAGRLPSTSALPNPLIMEGTEVSAIVVDPDTPNVITVTTGRGLAGTTGGIWRSTDSGATWKNVTPAGFGGDWSSVDYGAYANPQRGLGRVWAYFAACEGVGIFRSFDHGATWKKLNNIPLAFNGKVGGPFGLKVAASKSLDPSDVPATKPPKNYVPARPGIPAQTDKLVYVLDGSEGFSDARVFKSLNGDSTVANINGGEPSWTDITGTIPTTEGTLNNFSRISYSGNIDALRMNVELGTAANGLNYTLTTQEALFVGGRTLAYSLGPLPIDGGIYGLSPASLADPFLTKASTYPAIIGTDVGAGVDWVDATLTLPQIVVDPASQQIIGALTYADAHVDQHGIAQNPLNNDMYVFANDGGVYLASTFDYSGVRSFYDTPDNFLSPYLSLGSNVPDLNLQLSALPFQQADFIMDPSNTIRFVGSSPGNSVVGGKINIHAVDADPASISAAANWFSLEQQLVDSVTGLPVDKNVAANEYASGLNVPVAGLAAPLERSYLYDSVTNSYVPVTGTGVSISEGITGAAGIDHAEINKHRQPFHSVGTDDTQDNTTLWPQQPTTANTAGKPDGQQSPLWFAGEVNTVDSLYFDPLAVPTIKDATTGTPIPNTLPFGDVQYLVTYGNGTWDARQTSANQTTVSKRIYYTTDNWSHFLDITPDKYAAQFYADGQVANEVPYRLLDASKAWPTYYYNTVDPEGTVASLWQGETKPIVGLPMIFGRVPSAVQRFPDASIPRYASLDGAFSCDAMYTGAQYLWRFDPPGSLAKPSQPGPPYDVPSFDKTPNNARVASAGVALNTTTNNVELTVTYASANTTALTLFVAAVDVASGQDITTQVFPAAGLTAVPQTDGTTAYTHTFPHSVSGTPPAAQAASVPFVMQNVPNHTIKVIVALPDNRFVAPTDVIDGQFVIMRNADYTPTGAATIANPYYPIVGVLPNRDRGVWRRVGSQQLASSGTISTMTFGSLGVTLPNYDRMYVGTTAGDLWISNPNQALTQIQSQYTGSLVPLTVGWTKIAGPGTGSALPQRPVTALATNAPSLAAGVGDLVVALGGASGVGHLWRSTNTTSTTTPVFTDASGARDPATGLPLASSLPDVPVYDVIRDPDDPTSTYYVATDAGIYTTIDGGSTWINASIPLGMPNVECRKLKMLVDTSGTKYLTVATYGRGVYTLNLGKLTPVVVPPSLSFDTPSFVRTGTGANAVISVTLPVKNTGAGPAQNVLVTSASISTTTGTPVTVSTTSGTVNVGTIAPNGGQSIVTLTFPAAALGRTGTSIVFKAAGTYMLPPIPPGTIQPFDNGAGIRTRLP